MNRVIARLPESITELCLVRLGIQVKSPAAWLFSRRLRWAIDADSRQAIAAGSGLLNSEFYAIALNHFGVLQYWQQLRRPGDLGPPPSAHRVVAHRCGADAPEA